MEHMKKTIDEQIAYIDFLIQELEKKKKELIAKKAQEDFRKYLNLAMEEGKKPDEFVDQLLQMELKW